MSAIDWLVIDTHYLVWREFYGSAKYDPVASVINAVSRLPELAARFNTDQFVFCFDRPPYKRAEVFPGYKNKKVAEELEYEIEQTRFRIHDLGNWLLNELGFENVHYERGYEADDIMAWIVKGLQEEDRAILVSEDRDLYQLLSWRCAVYHPRKNVLYTAKDFRKEFDCSPNWWKGAKAIAGENDKTDNIPGVDGVGIITAIKYMKSALSEKAQTHAAIKKFLESENYQRNLKLISLPFDNSCGIVLQRDSGFDEDLQKRFCDLLGLEISDPDAQRKNARKGIDI